MTASSRCSPTRSSARRISPPRSATCFAGTSTEQEHLVLKPNRGYGGHGVCVGAAVSKAAWEEALRAAALQPNGWVAQRAVPLPVHEFPVLVDGNLQHQPFYIVVGLAPTEDGVAVLGRASQKQVVNIAQRG